MANTQIKGISVVIDGNTTKLNDALKQTDKAAKSTQSELAQINRQLRYDPSNVMLLTQKHEVLGKRIEEVKGRLETLKTAQDQFDESTLGTEKGAEQYRALQREIEKTQSNLQYLQQQYENTDPTNVKLQNVQNNVKAIGDKATEAGKKVTTHVTAPIAAVGVASVKSFETVESGLDVVKQKTGASGKSLEQMEKITKGLATTLDTSFEDAGTAVGEVNTRFGLTGKSLQSVSADFLKFAKINNVDVNSSIDQVQKAMATFGVDASQAGDVLDVLNKVGQNTGISMDTLEQSLVANSSTLHAMGLNLDQSAQLLGTLEKSGADSNTVMSGLGKALKNATAQGIPLNQALADIQNEVVNGKDGMTGLQASYDLFGKSGAEVYQAVKDGSLDFSKLGETVKGASGSVDDVYKNTDKLSRKMTPLKNQLTEGLGDIGEQLVKTLIPVLKEVLKTIKSMTKQFESLDPNTQKMIIKAAILAAALGPLVVVFGSLCNGVSSIVGLMIQLHSGFVKLRALQMGTKISGLFGKVKGGLSDVLTMITGHPVIAGISLLVIAIVLLYTKCDWFRNGVNAIISNIVAFFRSAYGTITGLINILKQIITTLLTTISSVFDGLWGRAVGGVSSLYTNTINFFRRITTTGGNVLRGFWSVISGWAGALWDYASGGISRFVSNVASGLQRILNIRNSLYNWGADMVTGLVQGLEDGVRRVKTAAGKLARAIYNKLHFSRPEEGELRDYETWMPDFVHGLSVSLTDALPELDSAVSQIGDKLKTGAIPQAEGGSGTAYTIGDININITTQQGQSAEEIAQEVQRMIVHDIQRSR